MKKTTAILTGIFLLIVFSGFTTSINAQSNTPDSTINADSIITEADSIIGEWYTDARESIIKIYKKQNKYYGKIIRLKEPNGPDGKPKLDKRNSDKKLRNRKIVGLNILTGMVHKKDNIWANGKTYTPRRGKSFDCRLELVNPNKLEITVLVGMFSKTKVWIRKK